MAMGRQPERSEDYARTHAAIAAAGPMGSDRATLETALGLNVVQLDRVLIWLLKYGFIRRQRAEETQAPKAQSRK